MNIGDLMPKVAPKLYFFVPKDLWEAVKINGKIHKVPSAYKENVIGGFVWREDPRKKYNLPKLTDMKTFEAYLQGIKKNEPTMIPLMANAAIEGVINGFSEFRWLGKGGSLPIGYSAQQAQ